MTQEDAEIYRRMINKLREITAAEDPTGAQELPSYFLGFTNELLYNEGTHNEALVLFADGLVAEVESKSDTEIMARLKLLEDVLFNIYSRYKSIASQSDNARH